jgi:hypothetical protein
MKRRTEITIETERLLVLGRSGGHDVSGSHERPLRPFVWCLSCADHVRPLSTDEAAIQASVTSLTIFHWVESNLLHYIESSEGLLLICPNSLQTPKAEENESTSGQLEVRKVDPVSASSSEAIQVSPNSRG